MRHPERLKNIPGTSMLLTHAGFTPVIPTSLFICYYSISIGNPLEKIGNFLEISGKILEIFGKNSYFLEIFPPYWKFHRNLITHL